jgi:hypothetical protein
MHTHHTPPFPEQPSGPEVVARRERPGSPPGRGPGGHPGGGRGRRGAGGERGSGRRGGWQVADLPSAEDAGEWFAGRLPEDWFTDVDVTVDREEITVVGTLAGEPAEGAEAEGRIGRFRADTRDRRIEIAREAEERYRRTVSWGARMGDTDALFTHLAAPVMTRLRQPERQVLDTLVDAGVARSRSDALAWCVRLVGEHADAWLDRLREAMAEVDQLRATGPEV